MLLCMELTSNKENSTFLSILNSILTIAIFYTDDHKQNTFNPSCISMLDC